MSTINNNSKRDLVLRALLEGKSQVEAATSANVTDRTVRRWLRDPEFAADLTAFRGKRFARTLDRIAAVGEQSVEVLRSTAVDSEMPPAVRVAAARTLLGPILREL